MENIREIQELFIKKSHKKYSKETILLSKQALDKTNYLEELGPRLDSIYKIMTILAGNICNNREKYLELLAFNIASLVEYQQKSLYQIYTSYSKVSLLTKIIENEALSYINDKDLNNQRVGNLVLEELNNSSSNDLRSLISNSTALYPYVNNNTYIMCKEIGKEHIDLDINNDYNKTINYYRYPNNRYFIDELEGYVYISNNQSTGSILTTKSTSNIKNRCLDEISRLYNKNNSVLLLKKEA